MANWGEMAVEEVNSKIKWLTGIIDVVLSMGEDFERSGKVQCVHFRVKRHQDANDRNILGCHDVECREVLKELC